MNFNIVPFSVNTTFKSIREVDSISSPPIKEKWEEKILNRIEFSEYNKLKNNIDIG